MASADGSFTDMVKRLIRFRAANRCEVCGIGVGEGAQYHHRRPRRMGGTSDPQAGQASNGMYLHAGCHRKVEENRLRSLGYGWLLPSEADPSKSPVVIVGAWRLLSDDGAYLLARDPSTPASPRPAPADAADEKA